MEEPRGHAEAGEPSGQFLWVLATPNLPSPRRPGPPPVPEALAQTPPDPIAGGQRGLTLTGPGKGGGVHPLPPPARGATSPGPGLSRTPSPPSRPALFFEPSVQAVSTPTLFPVVEVLTSYQTPARSHNCPRRSSPCGLVCLSSVVPGVPQLHWGRCPTASVL